MEFIRTLKKHLFNTKYLIVLLVFLLLVYNSLFQELNENIGLSIFFVRTASDISREFDSCLHFFTNQIAQNVDYINAFEFFLLSNL